MSAEAPPLIEIEGPPEARGAQYGAACDTRIKRGAELYRGLMQARGMEWGAVVDTARVLLARLAEVVPHHHAEILAIARGAGIDPAEVLVINGRSEILNAGTMRVPEPDRAALDDGCTAALALAERTAGGRLIHGQNWDWRPECSETAVVLAIRGTEHPDILTYVEAGGLARAGLNAAGIAVTGNNLATTDENWSAPGIPLAAIRRRILEAWTLGDAVKAVSRSPRSVSNNMTISCAGDGDGGEAVNLETTPGEIFWLMPEDGLLTHANHFVSEAAKAKIVDAGAGGDSLYRDRRVRRRLERDGDRITLDSFKAAFADRFGYPKAVLRAPDPGAADSISATVATIIMDAEERVMWVRQKPYEDGSYSEYRL